VVEPLTPEEAAAYLIYYPELIRHTKTHL
jgi:hypothetical protein